MAQPIDGITFCVEDLGLRRGLGENENEYFGAPLLSPSLSAVRMGLCICVDVNPIVMNSSIDSGHRYHSSLWRPSFVVICSEGRTSSIKHRHPSAFM